ncbi:MAG: PolC-type DNA polymerase III [Oligoflexales bacterium]
MSTALEGTSIFHKVLFPTQKAGGEHTSLTLQRPVGFQVSATTVTNHVPWVLFDLETTGLDSSSDRMIEIGAIRVEHGKVVDEFSTLIQSPIPIPLEVQKLTGIEPSMLEGQPVASDVLPDFLKFIQGSILVAHNASFDLPFLKNELARIGVDLSWPAFCTLKMAAHFLHFLPRKNLDTLAEHYELNFEARHRSIGDVKVTWGVLQRILSEEANNLTYWKDFTPFTVSA